MQLAIIDLKFDFVFSLKQVLGQESAVCVVPPHQARITLKFLLDQHQLRVGQVDALSDTRQVGKFVFVVNEAELLAHLVVLCQVNGDQLRIVQVEPMNGCI